MNRRLSIFNKKFESPMPCQLTSIRYLQTLVLICFVITSHQAAFADGGRYSAELADGSRISGDALANWYDEKNQLTLSGKAVFDSKNPFRWLVDHSLSPASEPGAFVEFFGGDRLPGEVIEFQSGRESPYLTLPKYVIVKPAVELHSPRLPRNSHLRIHTRWLKRVVWEARTMDRFEPGHAFLKDGRKIGYRSLRWSSDAVTLLLEDEILEISFGDLQELHLPLPDVWAIYYEQLAVLSPQSAFTNEKPARIVQLDTSDGLKATVSTERMKPFLHGNKKVVSSWFHQCQPAWSLDPFWVRFDSVRCRRFFWPHQVPLSFVTPTKVEQNSPLGNSWYWQIDRNVYRQPLQCDGKEFGWGFGVHAFHELVFPLPLAAREFRTRAGLDQSVGEGGCVKWQVELRGSEEKTLYQSPIIRGTKQVVDTSRLNLGAPDKSQPKRQLVLIVDPLIKGAPPGADPLDVRDSLNWLEPEIELDPVEIQREIARRVLSHIPVLADWKLETDPGETLLLHNSWDEYHRENPFYRVLLGTRGRFLSVVKTLRIGEEDRWLVLAVSRPHDKTPRGHLQVHIDGQAIAELEVPITRNSRGPDPLLVPIESYRGRTVSVRLVQFPDPEETPPKTGSEAQAFALDWRGIATSEHRPGLLPLMQENEAFLTQLLQGEGTASLDLEEPYSGSTSIKITPPECGQARLDNVQAAIRATPELGEYRYLSFAWKKKTGADILLGLAHQGELGGDEMDNARPRALRAAKLVRKRDIRNFQPLQASGRGLQYGYRYHQGKGTAEIGTALKLDRKIPTDWQRHTRDLYNDFGEFRLTGFSLLCPNGSEAWFDEIYLARDARDFEQLPSRLPQQKPPSDPNILRHEKQPERLGLVSNLVAPAFTINNSSDGVQLLKEYEGKTQVLKTHPLNQKTPCVFRAPLVLPARKKCQLELEVHRAKDANWQLIITANGEKLKDLLIGNQNANEKWCRINVDLSKFAGQAVMLEVQNAGNDWNNETAYWSRAAIVTEPE